MQSGIDRQQSVFYFDIDDIPIRLISCLDAPSPLYCTIYNVALFSDHSANYPFHG